MNVFSLICTLSVGFMLHYNKDRILTEIDRKKPQLFTASPENF